jgi:hypothetical protein
VLRCADVIRGTEVALTLFFANRKHIHGSDKWLQITFSRNYRLDAVLFVARNEFSHSVHCCVCVQSKLRAKAFYLFFSPYRMFVSYGHFINVKHCAMSDKNCEAALALSTLAMHVH